MIIFVAAQNYLQLMNKLIVNMKEAPFTVECSNERYPCQLSFKSRH